MLSILLWTNCDESTGQISIKPKKNKVYSYELNNYTQRLHKEEEASYENGLIFDITYLKKSKDGYLVNIKVNKLDIPGDDESPQYLDFLDFLKESFIGKENEFFFSKKGKIEYQDTSTISTEQKIEQINKLEDDMEYRNALYNLTLDELKKNMFNEWLAYGPESKLKDNKWSTSNPLEYADKIKAERKFYWKIVEETPDSIVIEGSNNLRNAVSKEDLGGGIILVTRFTGIMEFNSRIVIDPKDGMLISAKNTILTNGQITKAPEGMPDGSVVDLDFEPLEGIATTTITRIKK